MKRHKYLFSLAVAAVVTLTAQAGHSGPSTCPYCETDYFANGSCWGCGFHEHYFLGYWPYDGHTGYHTTLDCCDCYIHFGCQVSSTEAVNAINLALHENRPLAPVLRMYESVATFDSDRQMIVVSGCGSKDPTAEIALTRSQKLLL